jgi:hypothetical protein
MEIGIIDPNILLHLGLRLVVDLVESAEVGGSGGAAEELLDGHSATGLLDCAGFAVEDVGFAIAILALFVGVVEAAAVPAAFLELHGLRDVLERERILLVEDLHFDRSFR